MIREKIDQIKLRNRQCHCSNVIYDDEIEQIYSVLSGLASALQKISEYSGMTNLGDCCVNKTCSPAFDNGEKVAHCKFQFGVLRGFNECAATAKAALSGT